jgi:hypothetical protein
MSSSRKASLRAVKNYFPLFTLHIKRFVRFSEGLKTPRGVRQKNLGINNHCAAEGLHIFTVRDQSVSR